MRVISPSSSSGFTLIELVVVMAVVGLISAIGIRRYSSSSNVYRAELAARRILADLNLARSQAKITSQSQSVIFNLSANTYTLPGITSLDTHSSNYIVNLAADPYRCTLVSASFNNTQQVTFDAYGSCDNSGQIIVQCNGIRTSVTLESTSGRGTVP